MSVRPPTSKSKTEPYSSVAEKIKALKERKKKGNPFSSENKKITLQIKKLEQSQQPASQKFTGTGKEIGVNKTKTGQFKEKTPKVKTPLFKLKDDPSKRLREKRLALEKANREKVRLAKGRKASEKLQDIPPGRKPGMVIGKPKKEYTPKTKVKGRGVDKTSRGPKPPKALKTDSPAKTYGGPLISKPKPVSKVVSDKPKPVSKVTDKPKTKDMSIWDTIKKGWANLQNTPHGAKEIAESRTRAVNKKMTEAPASVKRMKEYKQIGDMLKARQAKPTGKDIASGRDAEARRKAAKAKQQASRTKTRTGTFKDLYQRQPKKPATAVPVKTPISKVVPKKFTKITPRRKPIPPKTKTFTDPYKDQKDRKLGTGIPKPRTFEDPYKGQPKKPATGIVSKPQTLEQKLRAKFVEKRGGEGAFGKRGSEAAWQTNLFDMRRGSEVGKTYTDQQNYEKIMEERKEATAKKRGGRVGKKKQGYKARKDESIAMRVKKKRTKKQLKVSRSDSYGKWGKGKGKGKINRSGAALVAASYD